MSRHASDEGDTTTSWPLWVLIGLIVVLAAIFLPPLTRQSTAASLCIALAPDDTSTVRWSLNPLLLPHWQCALDDGSVIDLGWWPVSN